MCDLGRAPLQPGPEIHQPEIWGPVPQTGLFFDPSSSPPPPPPPASLVPKPEQGEKNHGFEVLYHSVKQGPISTKELADFIRERATIEETYSKAMAKLSKLASNGTPMGTFAPLWEVFRVSSDKLALCHLELTRKLQDLIKDVLRYGEEQLKTHKKCKDEVVGTLDAVQVLTGVSQLLPKSRENYLNRRFQAMEETHLRHMKALLGSYAHSVEDTHVQIGQVHEEFKQNIENVSVEMLIRKFAESKGTGQEKPSPLDFEAYSAAVLQEGNDVLEPDSGTCPEVDEEGFTVRPDVTQNNILLAPPPGSCCDSDFDDEEPRKFYVHIKPPPARAPACSSEAAAAQLRATAGSLILPPGPGGTMKRHSSRDAAGKPQRPRSAPRAGSCAEKLLSDEQVSKNLFGPPLESAFDHEDFTDLIPAAADSAAREGLAAPPRRPRTRKVSCPLTRSNGDLSRSLSPSPLGTSAPSAVPERPSFSSQTSHGVSRGPSPVVLGSQDALPVATAFTEYVHAYFRGHNTSCLARVTGELTMTFPAGIVRVFSGTPPPPVLSFRLIHTAPIEHFQPNADLVFSDPSQSDPEAKDFWLNMATLTEALQQQAEQNPAASYYNVVLLKYQFSRPGPQSVPLQLSAHWQCGATLTQVSVEYSYRPGATAVPTPLTNVQILLPVGEPVTNVRLQPAATCWEPLSGPSTPSPVAAQFTSEGATLSGVDVELVGGGYRMSLVKRRFATGMYLVSC
ncbi:FCH domain only protein 1 [Tupaia chinensis]|uniref:FCH domain only protein 1 n=1 Tax=Tupaia chinensis TaxID=246437 RepID=L9KXF6_TUPCH|nr:FCH domain only protein 1 [Tupaia chinensis]